MKLTVIFLALISIVPAAVGADLMAQHFLSPEIILHKADELGLTNDQRHGINETMQATHAEMQEKQKRVKACREALEEVLESHPVDLEKAKQSLLEMLSAEQEFRVTQAMLMLEIRNLLSDGQLAAVKEIVVNMPPPDPALRVAVETRIKPKMETVHQAMMDNAEGGTPPTESMRRKMQGVHELLKVGKVYEAEKMLDALADELGI